MAVLSKDAMEMLRFAGMSYALEERYGLNKWKGEPDRSREHVMACKNLAVAHASNGDLQEALGMLQHALESHKQRYKQEFDPNSPLGSETRYLRDEFELRYHVYMVEGLMASQGLMKPKEAEGSYRDVEALISELPTEAETIEGKTDESSTTVGKITGGKTTKARRRRG